MIRCAYCRQSHESQSELEACAHRIIIRDAMNYRREKELDAAARQALDDFDDCAEDLYVAHPEDRLEAEA